MSDLHGGQDRHQTKVDLAGLMAVLSQHLYSTPEVAIRELVQNAHDSIVRRHHLALDGRAALVSDAPSITVHADPGKGIVQISDNGSGLTRSEIHTMLATVGVGATGQIRAASDDQSLIGMFGLGFLSSFVVAAEVRLVTTSATAPETTYEYRSNDGREFSLDEAPSRPIGSTVELRLKPGFADLADPVVLLGILQRYCRLLHTPLVLVGEDAPVNLEPPWRTASPRPKDQLDFAAAFDRRFEPIAAIPIGDPGSEFVGQLWLHATSTYGNSDNRRLSIFVRGMLLTDNDVDLLPRWAGFVSGAIESSHLTPTASRESLQKDATYDRARVVIGEALTSGLAALAANDQPTWRRVLGRHSEALLGAAIADDRLYDVLAEDLTVPTTQGARTLPAMVRSRRIHVSLGPDAGFEELLFAAQGIPVARGDLYGVASFARMYADREGLEIVEIGTQDGNAKLFIPAALDLDDLAWLERELASEDEAIAPVRFDPPRVPLVVVPDREAALKKRVERDELDELAGSGIASLARLHTSAIANRAENQLYVNVSCPTVQRMLEVRVHNPVGAQRAIALLRAMKLMMASMDSRSESRIDLAEAFDDAMAVLDGLLIEGGNHE